MPHNRIRQRGSRRSGACRTIGYGDEDRAGAEHAAQSDTAMRIAPERSAGETRRPVWEAVWRCAVLEEKRKDGSGMKKKFKLEDLDCANCAAKMEEAIKKIEGVSDANVSFMTQKMTVDAADDRFDEIMKEVVAVCAKVEPECRILM